MTHPKHPHGAMSCREMIEYLSDYIDGDLDADLRRLIERHGGDCPPCKAFVGTLARTVEAVRALPRDPLPPSVRRALAEALRKARS